MNQSGKTKKIHLYHQPRKTKTEGIVSYYSLATCCKKDGKNMKEVIHYLGRLSDTEAHSYRSLLKTFNSKFQHVELVDMHDILLGDSKKYLDSLVLYHLWKKLGLHQIFSSIKKGNQVLSTEQTMAILTINRILDPKSKTGTIEWFNDSLLSSIMGIDQKGYTKNKIFNELEKIHAHKEKMEEFFWNFSKKQRSDKYEVYYYDGTSSWFEGHRCPFAEYGLEKTRGFYDGVIGLMLVTDQHGFPVSWEVVNGNERDVTTFAPIINRVKKKFNIDKITYCFDRGVASNSNFQNIKEKKEKFISGIKDNQIKNVFDLDKFYEVKKRIIEYSEKELFDRKGTLPINGFYSSNHKVFYKDLGIIEGDRYIASFNLSIFYLERSERRKKIDKTIDAINSLNRVYSSRKKSLQYKQATKDVLEILRKNKASAYIDFSLIENKIDEKIISYKIELKLKTKKIESSEQTDGLMLYITNHIEKDDNSISFKLSAFDIVKHYRNKYIIENAFREMKSFMGLRPFYVWKEHHVRAHYDIGIMAYFINNYITHMLLSDSRSVGQYFKLVKKGFAKDIKIIEKYIKKADLSLTSITTKKLLSLAKEASSDGQKLSSDFINLLEDYCTSISTRTFYKNLNKNSTVNEIISPSGVKIYKMKPLDHKIKGYFNRLNMAFLASPSIHTSIGIYQ